MANIWLVYLEGAQQMTTLRRGGCPAREALVR
jgi:hypothetical protein